jgi:hypothetical protein
VTRSVRIQSQKQHEVIHLSSGSQWSNDHVHSVVATAPYHNDVDITAHEQTVLAEPFCRTSLQKLPAETSLGLFFMLQLALRLFVAVWLPSSLALPVTCVDTNHAVYEKKEHRLESAYRYTLANAYRMLARTA